MYKNICIASENLAIDDYPENLFECDYFQFYKLK
jgi:hypothetical protein